MGLRSPSIDPGGLESVTDQAARGDAAFYRDTRSRVLKSAVWKSSRRSLPMSGSMGSSTDPEGSTEPEDHRAKARAYAALATQLAARGNGGAQIGV